MFHKFNVEEILFSLILHGVGSHQLWLEVEHQTLCEDKLWQIFHSQDTMTKKELYIQMPPYYEIHGWFNFLFKMSDNSLSTLFQNPD